MSSDDTGPLPETREADTSVRPSTTAKPVRPAWHPEALHSEAIRLAHVAARLENLEELFAPESKPRVIEYGVQPPG